MKKMKKWRRLFAIILAFCMISQNAWSIMADVNRDDSQTKAGEASVQADDSGAARTGTDQAGTDQAGTDQAGTDQAGTDQAGTDQAGTDQTGTDQAGTDQTDPDRSNLDSDELDQRLEENAGNGGDGSQDDGQGGDADENNSLTPGAGAEEGSGSPTQSSADVSAQIYQEIYQRDDGETVHSYVQMRAEVTNNDPENAATGVSVKVLLPEQLRYMSSEYETGYMSSFNYPEETNNYADQNPAFNLDEVSQSVLDAHANGQVMMWVDETIGAGETAAFCFAAEIDADITSVAGLDCAWYVNGSGCGYHWVNAELIAPEVTPEATPEATPAVTPEAGDAADVTDDSDEKEDDKEYKTEFHYEDDSVVITATAAEKAMLPENTELKAVRMPAGSAFYHDAVAIAENQLGAAENADYVCYDVYFEANGQKIEPADGLVQITMDFKNMVFKETENAGGMNVDVIHINEETGKAEDVTNNVELNDAGDVSSVGFTTDSLSPVLLRRSGAPLNNDEVTYADPAVTNSLDEFISGVTVYTSNGEEYNPTKDVFPSNGRASFTLKISEDDSNKQDGKIHQIAANETYTYILPTELIKNIQEETGEIKDKNDASKVWGKYRIYSDADTDKLALDVTFNDNIGTKDDNGQPLITTTTITFTAQFNKEKIPEGGKGTIEFGNGVNVDVNFGKAQSITAVKSAGDFDPNIGEAGGFTFTIQMTVDEDIDTSIELTDTLGFNLEYVGPLSAVNTETSDEVEYNSTAKIGVNPFTITFPNGLKKGDYTISYPTKINEDAIEKPNGSLISGLTNKASIKNEEEIIEVNHEVKFSYPWIDKKGTQSAGSKEVIWNLTVNEPAKLSVAGKVVRDELMNPDIYYNLNKPVKIYQIQSNGDRKLWETLDWNVEDGITLNSDQKSWFYTMPGDAGTSCYIFEYSTIASKDGTYLNIGSVGDAQASGNITISTGTGTGIGSGLVKESLHTVTDAKGDKYVKWKSTITVDRAGSSQDVIYKDFLLGNHEFAVPLELAQTTDGTPEKTDTDFFKKIYVSGMELKEGCPSLSSTTKAEFKINFGKFTSATADHKITLIYYSKAGGSGNMENIGQAMIGDTSYADSDSEVISSYGIEKSGKYNSNGTIDWTIFIENGTGDWASFTDTYSAEYQEILTNTFSISEGSTLQNASLYLRNISDNKSGSLSFDAYLSDKNSSYTITYKSKLKNIDDTTMHGNISVTNKVTTGDITSNEAKVTIPSNVFDKILTQEATPDATGKYIAKYELKINENELDLSGGDAGFKDYYIEDTMGDRVKILVDTIRIIDNKGELIPTDAGQTDLDKDAPYYTYSINGKKLNVIIHNGNPHSYILMYDAQIMPKTPGVEEEVTYDNKASFKIANVTVSDDVESKVTIKQDSSASSEATYIWTKIKKVDKYNNGIALSGAKFSLYSGNYKSLTEAKEETPIAVSETANKESTATGIKKGEGFFGSIDKEISNGNLKTGQTYTIFETQAPEGYELDPTPHVFTVPPAKGTMELPEGSEWLQSGDTISFQDIPVTSLNVKKVWNDNEDEDGNRPKEITINLMKSLSLSGSTDIVETESADTVSLSDASDTTGEPWEKRWSDLPQKEQIESILYDVTYSIEEVGSFTDYTKAWTGEYNSETNTYEYTLTNTYARTYKNVSVEKVWEDADNQDGYRPAEIKVTLKRTFINKAGKAVTETVPADLLENGQTNEVTLKPSDKDSKNTAKAWPTYTWTHLQRKMNGKDIEYSVEESISYDSETPENQKYTLGIPVTTTDKDGNLAITLTNSLTTEKVSVSVNKEWKNDDDNADGNRPRSIEYELWKKVGEKGSEKIEGKDKKITPNESGAWPSAKWENLPKKENGELITYTVIEKNVTYYTSSVSEDTDSSDNFIYTVINAYERPETGVKVTKNWDDSNDNDGMRPEQIKVTVKEKLTGGSTKEVTFTENNLSPDAVLSSDENGKWSEKGASYEWQHLLKVRNGKNIEYTVEESAIDGQGSLDGYTAAITDSYDEENNIYVISLKNAKAPDKTSVKIKKIWEDENNQDGVRNNIASITLQLKAAIAADSYGSYKNVGNAIILSETAARGDWEKEWKNLDKFENGKLIRYSVTEEISYENNEDTRTFTPKYNKTYVTGDMKEAERTIEVTNCYTVEKTSIRVQKKWEDSDNADGVRLTKVLAELYGTDKVTPVKTQVLNENNSWKWSWNNLPVYENGKRISYTIKENDDDNQISGNDYICAVTTDSGDAYSFILTNTRNRDSVGIKVVKTWKDDDNREALRPNEIEVQLLVNGKTVTRITDINGNIHDGKIALNDSNQWMYDWGQLPKKEAGEVIKYTVDEVKIPEGYTKEIVPKDETTYTLFEITNTHEIEKTFRKVQKVWDDKNDTDNIRKGSVKVQLYADGNAYGKELELNNSNDWSGKWTGLPVYKNANNKKVGIEYTLKEAAVDGYQSSIEYTERTGDAAVNLYTVTNTHTPDTTNLSVQKDWDDGENVNRPTEIKVILKADGVQLGEEVALNNVNNWHHEWTNLPVNKEIADPTQDKYQKIVYTVEETTKFADGSYQVSYQYLKTSAPSAADSVGKEENARPGTVNPAQESWSSCVVTNRLETDKTRVLLIKYWNDNGNPDRPEKAVFQLYREVWNKENQAYGTKEAVGENVELSGSKDKDVWTYTWEGLPTKLAAADPNEKNIIYSVEEVDVPEGYTAIVSGVNNIFTAANIKPHVEISKTAIGGAAELPGATLELYEKGTAVSVETWVSKAESHIVKAKLTPGKTYILREAAAPNGYALAQDVEFTVLSDGSVQKITMEDAPIAVTVSKKTLTGETETMLPGAKLQILDSKGNVAETVLGAKAEWTTSNNAVTITGLPAGTYRLHEASVPLDAQNPQGYYHADDIEFELTSQGEVLVNDKNVTGTDGIVMYDYPTKVSISKKGLIGEEELPGAELTLYELVKSAADTSGEEGTKDTGSKAQVVKTKVESWTTGNTPHVIIGKLIVGHTYVLEETKAPEGYSYAGEIEFTVKDASDENADPKVYVQSVTMKDGKNNIVVSKKALTGEAELPGAKLQLLHGTDVIETWVSEAAPHAVLAKLSAGEEYVLRELNAPAGYLVANDIIFKINNDGSAEVIEQNEPSAKPQAKEKQNDGQEPQEPVNHVIVMRDAGRTVKFLKSDEEGNPIAGAKLQVLDSAGKMLEEWISTDAAYELKLGLSAGQEYTLHEAEAPNGYTVAEDVKFTLDAATQEVTVTMSDTPTEVTVSKTDITGEKSLGGAVLQIVDGDGNVIAASWTTEDGKDKTFTGVLSVNVPYTLEEVTPPDYYGTAKSIGFMLNDKGKIMIEDKIAEKVVMKDAPTRIRISKKDVTGEDELPGAVLQIIDKETKLSVDEWTTTDKPYYSEGKVIVGRTYLLHEKQAPEGYGYAKDVEFTVKTDSVVGSEQKVVMYDSKNVVLISKTDLSGAKELPGAKLQLLDKTGMKVLETWTSTNEEYKITHKLEAGETYILRETEAPDGYALAKDIRFTVNKDGTPTKVVMKDAPTSTTVSKTDLTGEKEIAGAKLQILNKASSKVMEEWISDGRPHAVQAKLNAGGVYILHEVSAPEGYWLANDVEFTVNEDGKTTAVTMKDAPTEVKILKIDEKGTGLPGAELAVKDADGKEVERWISDGKAHVISGKLIAGASYTLTELAAPEGYQVAADMKFTVTEKKDTIEITMKDEPETGKKGKLTVTKRVTLLDGDDVIDLMIQDRTFYVGLFKDSAGTQPYGSIKALKLENASSAAAVFNDLPSGTYYAFETDAQGNVIPLNEIQKDADGKEYVCVVDGSSNSVKIDVKAQNADGKILLNNRYYDIPGHASIRAQIDISKQVLKGTNQTTVKDTFYAGIYTKNAAGEYEWFKTVELKQNETVQTEVPLGGEKGMDPITYYVFETDSEGTPVDLDVFEYEVSGEGKVTLDTVHTKDKIAIVNRLPEENQLLIRKVDGKGIGLSGAQFRLVDEAGKTVAEWTSGESAEPMQLKEGTYVLKEIKAPAGYIGGGDVKLTVSGDGVYGINASGDASLKGNILTYVNRLAKTTVNNNGGGGGGGTSNVSSVQAAVKSAGVRAVKSVKTGDETPVGLYLALLAGAVLLAGGVIVAVRRKKRK